jgi:hypothetical protein
MTSVCPVEAAICVTPRLFPSRYSSRIWLTSNEFFREISCTNCCSSTSSPIFAAPRSFSSVFLTSAMTFIFSPSFLLSHSPLSPPPPTPPPPSPSPPPPSLCLSSRSCDSMGTLNDSGTGGISSSTCRLEEEEEEEEGGGRRRRRRRRGGEEERRRGGEEEEIYHGMLNIS